MKTERLGWAVSLAAGVAAGCGSAPPSGCATGSQPCSDDAATADAPIDVTLADAPFDAAVGDAWFDAAVADATASAEAGPDRVGTSDPCASGAIVDLATAGTREGNVTRYLGDNRAIAANATVGWVCTPTVAPVFHRYVPTSGGRLSVDAQRVGDFSGFSPIVMVADGCGTLGYGGPNVFVCVNPTVYIALGIFPRAVLSVAAGVPIYVVVAGDGQTSTRTHGSYVLTITEARAVGAGATCDRAGVTWTCVAGLSCSSTEPPRCVADGTLGGACREGSSGCDPGLRCWNGHCVMPSTGPGCFPTCPLGSGCLWEGGVDRCVLDGTNGGPCRSSTPSSLCDRGLACSAISRRCRPSAAPGAACDSAGATSACVEGTACVAGVCAAVGVRGGFCRPGGDGTLCDEGLVCSNTCPGCAGGRCVQRTTEGGACATSATCLRGYTCVTVGAASTCAADGTASGAACRRSLTRPPCDVGLTCGGRERCAPTLAAGAACGETIEGACAVGTSCQRATATDAGLTPDDASAVPRCLPALYVESTAPAGEYIDACAAGRAEPFYSRDLGDNRTLHPLVLPFAFRYFGRLQTHFWPGTGAWASFGTERPPISSVRFAYVTGWTDVVQPFGAHTAPIRESVNPSVWLQPSGSRLCQVTVGAAPDRRFAVEWNDLTIANAGDAAHLTFEVVLHETTDVIDFLYRRLDYAAIADAPGAELEVDIGLLGRGDDAPAVHRGPVSTAAGVRFTPR